LFQFYEPCDRTRIFYLFGAVDRRNISWRQIFHHKKNKFCLSTEIAGSPLNDSH